MKKKIIVLMAAALLFVVSAGTSFADEDPETIIAVEESTDVDLETELDSAKVSQEMTENAEASGEEETDIAFVESVEAILGDDPAMIQEDEDEPATIASTGTCGDNLTWTLSAGGTLIISGNGSMEDYNLESVGVEDSIVWGEWYYDENGYLTRTGSYTEYEQVWTAPWADSASSIVSVVFEEGVTHISSYAFYACDNIKEISISDTVLTIGECAFFWCTGVTSVTLGNNVTTIGRAAFDGCNSLTSMTVPKSVTSIGDLAIGYEYGESQYGKGSDPMVFTIYGYTGSAAEAYASISDKFTFVALDGGTVTLAKGKISSLTNTSSGIKIKWSQVSGADGYYIYRKTSSGSYTKIKTIKSGSTTSYTDKKVADNNGTTYTYKVVPYSGSTKGSGTAKTTVRLTGTSLKSLKNSATTKVKVKWTAVSNVTGYQIQYSTSSSFSSYKTKKVSGATSASKALRSLTMGKTYYVRIRTYKTVNGTTYYSAWSSKLKVKITK